jgi:uncharacterized protein YkwD
MIQMRAALRLAVALAGCAPPMAAAPPTMNWQEVGVAEEELAVGPAAGSYLTSAQPNGVVGGRAAEELAAAVAQALRERGAEAEADGALAATAWWFLREAVERRSSPPAITAQVARHHGFAGDLLTSVTVDLSGPERDFWRKTLAEVPLNVPITRFGVRALRERGAAISFGSVEANLDPIPRRLKPGQAIRLRGEIGKRFARAVVYVTGPEGKVAETRLPSRQVQAALAFPARGVYQVEVMGDGATGPVVLVNVPIYVGVPEPEIRPGPISSGEAAAPAVDAATAEARLLVLLNAARAKAGLAPLASDAELRVIALGHSEDMARAHFIGHVSPTTGNPEDRIKRAGVPVTGGGENIARAAGADAAHQDLMDSPGHRSNMLSPRFTHVGIGVVPQGDQILATLVFGRRRDLTAPWTAKVALDAIAAIRQARGLEPVHEEMGLRAAAQAGMRAFPQGGTDAVFKATNTAIGEEVGRGRLTWRAGCVRIFEIADVDQLDELPVVLDPRLRRIGIGTAQRPEGRGIMLVLLIVSEGRACE